VYGKQSNSLCEQYPMSKCESTYKPPSQPTPSPPGPAPSGSFEKHDNAYCGITGTDATRVSSKTGITGDECEKLCVADNECVCYDHKDDKETCRLYHGHPKVVSSADGYKAYTRDRHT
jgi:hypothetical protein